MAHLNALGGRPGGAAREYSCRPGSRGVMGRRVDTRRAPGEKCRMREVVGEKKNISQIIIKSPLRLLLHPASYHLSFN